VYEPRRRGLGWGWPFLQKSLMRAGLGAKNEVSTPAGKSDDVDLNLKNGKRGEWGVESIPKGGTEGLSRYRQIGGIADGFLVTGYRFFLRSLEEPRPRIADKVDNRLKGRWRRVDRFMSQREGK